MNGPKPTYDHGWRSWPEERNAQPAVAAARDAVKAGDAREAADAYLLAAAFELGSAERQNALKAADICATLTLRDAIQEAATTLKEVTTRQIDATVDLNGTVQTATKAVIRELRKVPLENAA